MKVLTINTYAGSLLLAAKAAGLPVVASLEDSNFGVDIQRLNFPELKIFYRMPWPRPHNIPVDPQETIVIAHPPCSAFSVQNNSAAKKGADSDAFACTIKVLEYGMDAGFPLILVESVIGAMEGARHVHEEYAQNYGYRVFRFLVNSCSFAVPQDRPRFWIAFARKPSNEDFMVDWFPMTKLVREVIGKETLEKRVDDQVVKLLRRQTEKWTADGVDPELVRSVLAGERGFGGVCARFETPRDYDKYAIGGFRSKDLRMLNPDGLATTLLGDSHWIVPGRQLWAEEYFELMGFPRDYKMPSSYMTGKFKTYLSKGVCPPVAQWFLEQGVNYLNDIDPPEECSRAVSDGGVLDLRPGRGDK